MRILNVYRSRPSDLVRLLVAGMSKGDTVVEAPLHDGKVDYAKLVEDIFKADRVICWW